MNEALAQFEPFVLALLLGLLVGLQRERRNSPLAGVRTFPLITLLGTISGVLAAELGGWMVAAGLLALAVVLLVGNLQQLGADSDQHPHPGTTTEMAILVMFGVGALLALDYIMVSVTLGASVALLLHFKPELHGFAAKLGKGDVRAIMQFVAISCIILPVVPDQTFGPYDVLNPRIIWWMVVLIVGLSLGAYIVYRFVGTRAGILFGGLMGGLVSSTATTVSFARRAKQTPELVGSSAVVIVLSSAAVYVRLLLALAVVSPRLLVAAAPPLGVLLGVSLVIAAVAYLRRGPDPGELPPQKNPSELMPALIFAALFAVVLLGLAAARDLLGDSGLYGVAWLSGLTKMDAITLSSARMVEQGSLVAEVGWRMIVLAMTANTCFKGGIVAALGSRALFLPVAGFFGLHILACVVVLWLW